jgi:uncharacterized protein YcfJ
MALWFSAIFYCAVHKAALTAVTKKKHSVLAQAASLAPIPDCHRQRRQILNDRSNIRQRENHQNRHHVIGSAQSPIERAFNL